MSQVILFKSGNRITVEPTTPSILQLLQPILTFTEKIFLRGRERYQAEREGRSPLRFQDWECFGFDHKDRLSTSFGFYRRIIDKLKAAGYEAGLEDLTPHPHPEIFEPHWDRLADFTLRPGQPEFLSRLIAYPCGRFDCAPGFGKTFMIGLVALLLPKARIDVVTKRVTILTTRIYPELCGMLPSVGIYCSRQKRNLGARVMCFSAGSLRHTDGKADITIGDECHELGADSFAEQMAVYQRARCFGFSGSQDMRLDGKDTRVEGIFGPVIYRVPYQTAERNEIVVPIEVTWRDVNLSRNPCEGLVDTAKRRYGIWRNADRNRLIAADARLYDEKTQVLISVDTLEHAVRLKKLLPEFALVYAAGGLSSKDRETYVQARLLSQDEPSMTDQRLKAITKDFEVGNLKKAIATTVWNVGVDFRALNVVICTDAGASPINATQIRTRVSRINEGKSIGRVHDYLDQFDPGYRRNATSRSKVYAKHGWSQVYPPKPQKDSLLYSLQD